MLNSRNDLIRTLARPLAAVALAGASLGQAQIIDLSTWQTIQYELNSQPDSSWDLQPGNTSVLQSVNSDASILLSDFNAVGQEIRGTWRVETGSDDDFMGFVFGYQDRGHFYLFDWKQNSQSFQGDFAEVGMSLKVVQIPGGGDPTQDDLWPSTDSPNVTVPLHNTIPWVEFVDYEFVLNWVPGSIEITVLEDGMMLEHWVLADSTYTSGSLGFYNYSQDNVLYQSFTQQGVPEIYCTSKTNSVGCTPILEFSGFASATDPAPFDISAMFLINNKNGVLMYSANGRESTPFGGGLRCIAPALRRTPIQNTRGFVGPPDCTGTLSFDFNAWLQGGMAPSVMVGDRINAQYYYRDPQHSDGTGYGLTDAVEFFVLP